MEQLCQHLNFRDSDQHLWNTIDGGNDIHADSQQVVDETYDQSQHTDFNNAGFAEGMRACV